MSSPLAASVSALPAERPAAAVMMHRGTSYLSIDREDDVRARRPPRSGGLPPPGGALRGVGCLILGAAFLFLLSPAPNTHPGGVGGGLAPPPGDDDQSSSARRSAFSANDPRERTRVLPVRVRSLAAQHQIVGDRLGEVKEGKRTVEEIVHGGAHLVGVGSGNAPGGGGAHGVHAGGIGSSGHIGAGAAAREHKSAPMTAGEVVQFLDSFLKKLDSSNIKHKRATFRGIWAAYHDLVVKWLYPWDREYLRRMPPRREDGSLYLSVASFRDELCPATLEGAFSKAKHPEKLFVGLVQQNCRENCRSGVLDGNKVEDAKADPDCYLIFCSSEVGKKYCDEGHVRLLQMKESEALGPYMARYFASKLWMGEQWYMQIDSHMTFSRDWDAASIDMLTKAPSGKPVISHYPPSHKYDLAGKADVAAPRLCGPVFATSDLEGQIIKIAGGGYNYDGAKSEVPRFAPFVAAGYLIAHSDVLRDVPFDPFLPYMFVGEEILLSARLWTAGYDMFSPTHSLVGHHYVRNQKPKFWESIHRTFTVGVSFFLYNVSS
ncbi:hypothetical protein ACHAWF_002367 [Thalassiosira exigua]